MLNSTIKINHSERKSKTKIQSFSIHDSYTQYNDQMTENFDSQIQQQIWTECEIYLRCVGLQTISIHQKIGVTRK
jgi:hypothetical protein